MDTYKLEDKKLAIYSPLDMKAIIRSLKKKDQTSNFHEFLSEEILF
jgi:hypothetical protein